MRSGNRPGKAHGLDAVWGTTAVVQDMNLRRSLGVLAGRLDPDSGFGSAVAIRSYHTDGQGAFSFETDRTADQFLVAKAAGHASSEIALNTTGTVAELNVNFRLRPAGTVMGRVVDEKGNGVGGATIQVRYPGELRRHHFHHEVGDIQADDFGYFTLPVVARSKGFVVEAATAERLPSIHRLVDTGRRRGIPRSSNCRGESDSSYEAPSGIQRQTHTPMQASGCACSQVRRLQPPREFRGSMRVC